MKCPNCGTVFAGPDNFCRHCGWHLKRQRLPTVIESRRALTPRQVENAERALAVGGAATFAVGAMVWLAKRLLARQTLALVVSRLGKPAHAAKPARPNETDSAELQVETLMWIRRIRFR
ncbi:MAG: hypothetical protein HY259_05625 [Chloroflexi bacterium]|nr:hypothetical protein [Chloroflexota bacterium]